MNYDDNYEDEAFQTLRHFALVGLRNLNIQNRLIISYIISTIFPLLFVYLYSYYLYGIWKSPRNACFRKSWTNG